MDASAAWRVTCAFTAALGLTVLLGTPAPASAQPASLSDVLRSVAAYVENYLSRVQSIVGIEKVTVNTVTRDWTNDGRPRTLVYEFRLDWSPGAIVAVRRELLTVNGRRPQARDQPKCEDAAANTPEPLELLLPGNQPDFIFTSSGSARVDGRRTLVIAFETRVRTAASATWKDGCGSFDSGASRGRVWIDAVSGEVRRIESGLVKPVEVRVPEDQPWATGARNLTFERLDTEIRYRAFKFADPEETLLLPATIESLHVVRNAASLRVRHEYSGYRRFVTGGRLVPSQ